MYRAVTLADYVVILLVKSWWIKTSFI